jgi:hypothetical protein
VSVDWSKPLELNDGTPVRLVQTCPEDGSSMSGWRDVKLDGPDSHKEFRTTRTTRSFKKDGQNPIYSSLSVRNRSMIDTTKPLETFHPEHHSKADATFITLTSPDNSIMVGVGNAHWIIFDQQGKWVRSSQGQGSNLALRNKVTKTCEYRTVYEDGLVGDIVYHNRALAWDRHPNATHLIQFDMTDGKVTGVGTLKRPS